MRGGVRGWLGRGGGAVSKQPSRVGEVSQREEKSKELKVGKIYKVSMEDFLRRWRNSQMSLFQTPEKMEVSSS